MNKQQIFIYLNKSNYAQVLESMFLFLLLYLIFVHYSFKQNERKIPLLVAKFTLFLLVYETLYKPARQCSLKTDQTKWFIDVPYQEFISKKFQRGRSSLDADCHPKVINLKSFDQRFFFALYCLRILGLSLNVKCENWKQKKNICLSFSLTFLYSQI